MHTVVQVQTTHGKFQDPCLFRFNNAQRLFYFPSQPATLGEGEILKSRRKEVGFPKVDGKKSAARISAEIPWVNIVKTEFEILAAEADCTTVFCTGKYLGWPRWSIDTKSRRAPLTLLI